MRYLDQGLRPERVVHLGAADGDLGDAVTGGLVPDVGVFAGLAPGNLRRAARGLSHAFILHVARGADIAGSHRRLRPAMVVIMTAEWP